MSYEISMRKICEECGHSEYALELNITSNYYQAFVKMFNHDNGIRSLRGLTGAELIPILARAVGDMSEFTDTYVGIMPDNGWGDFNHLICFIQDLSDAAIHYPTYKLEVH